jgi:hypothetical protein
MVKKTVDMDGKWFIVKGLNRAHDCFRYAPHILNLSCAETLYNKTQGPYYHSFKPFPAETGKDYVWQHEIDSTLRSGVGTSWDYYAFVAGKSSLYSNRQVILHGRLCIF